MLNNVVQALGQLALIVLLFTVIVFLLTLVFAMVQSIIDSYKKRKLKDQYLIALDDAFENMLKDIEKQKKEKNKTKKVDKKDKK